MWRLLITEIISIFPGSSGYNKYAQLFLTFEYYNVYMRDDALAIKYLHPAKAHLTRLVEDGNGWVSHGTKLARVKHLVGDPDSEITETYNRTLQAVQNNNKDLVHALQALGLYYERCRKYQLAREYYTQAVTLSECTQATLAKNGLRIIRSHYRF